MDSIDFSLLFGFMCMIFVMFFLGIGFYIIERFFVWEPLAKHYRTDQEPVGRVWRWRANAINSVIYRGSVQLTTNFEGIFIKNNKLFGFGYPCIFIPWQEFHSPVLNNTWWQFYRWGLEVEVQVGTPRKATLKLPLEVFEETEGRTVLGQSPIGTNVPTS